MNNLSVLVRCNWSQYRKLSVSVPLVTSLLLHALKIMFRLCDPICWVTGVGANQCTALHILASKAFISLSPELSGSFAILLDMGVLVLLLYLLI